MQKLSNLFSSKSTTYFLIGILGILIYLSVFLFPQFKTLFHQIPEALRLKREVMNVEKDWADIDSFNQRIAQMNDKLNYYERSLPSEKEIAALLKFLSAIAKELDVQITEIQPLKKEEELSESSSVYSQVPIFLTAECGYHQLGQFLNRLENADRFMKISEIKIVANPNRMEHPHIRMTIVTYILQK